MTASYATPHDATCNAFAGSQDADEVPTCPHAITEAQVAAAKLALQAIDSAPVASAPFMDGEGDDADASWGPVVVCPSISHADLTRWIDDTDGMSLRRWSFEPLDDGSTNGRLVVYILPTFVHERTVGAISGAIIKSVSRLGNLDLLDSVDMAGSPTCHIGDVAQEPNSSFTPIDLVVGPGVLLAGNGQPFPTIVVEIAYKNESIPRLRAKLGRWMGDNTSVQVAIGIKIFARSGRRLAILHQRGQPVIEREFGVGVVAPSPLEFPLHLVYTGVPLPQNMVAFRNSMIQIDLVHLRNKINKLLTA